MRGPARRPAFTLIEFLVVLAIVGTLSALLLAATQRARAAAMRAACANNLRQIGLAFQHHHEVYQVFPGNGGWDDSQDILGVNGAPTYVASIEYFNPEEHYWGVGEPSLAPRAQTGSWAYALLPFLEQQNQYQQRVWTVGFVAYVCPARRTAEPQVAPDADEYAIYLSGGWAWGKTDYAANTLAVPNRPDCLSVHHMPDGTAHTILVGEKAMDPKNYGSGTWFWDEPYFLGGAGGTQRDGTALLRDGPGVDFPHNWGAAHSGGANFLFADGSAHLLSFGTPPGVVLALMTPRGGEVVSDPD